MLFTEERELKESAPSFALEVSLGFMVRNFHTASSTLGVGGGG